MKLPVFHIKSATGYAFIAGVMISSYTIRAHAQTTPADSLLNRTVIVEQQYNPDIMDARKINVVPEVEEIKVIPRQVEYDSRMVPATTLPTESMNAFAAREKQAETKKGYARLGYGTYGNLDAKLNYLLTLGEKDKLNLKFSMDGRDGKLKYADGIKWDNHYYRTSGGLNYLHQFGKADMDIGVDLGISNFNNPLQKKFTSGGGHIGLVSTDNDLPVRFKAETNLLLYSRHYNLVDPSAFNETIVRTKADVAASLSDEQLAGVAVEMNNRFYGFGDFKNLTTVLLNPYYALQVESWNVRLGANLDFGFGFGKKFNLSPDVKAEYIFSDSYILYAKATGGRISNDYRRLERIDPFAEIDLLQLEDSYRQLDAALGFKASPMYGLWFNLYGGYENTKRDLFTGLYRDENSTPITGSQNFYYLTNSNNIYIGADIDYNYKNIFSLALHGKYQSWDSGITNPSPLMPEFTMNGEIGINPVQKLNVSVGYEYIQRTRLDNAIRLDAVSNLRVGGSYQLLDFLTVYARGYNLLNKKYSYYLGYIDQGVSFLGGVSFRF